MEIKDELEPQTIRLTIEANYDDKIYGAYLIMTVEELLQEGTWSGEEKAKRLCQSLKRTILKARGLIDG